ncbi:hypothetical protein CRG98_015138 [Punica granatum]|uniref:Uncharacterized protein n=1 Tax=Punica granatum TaxID=22663 RepID=A0A2I0K7E4_PUNGR|nr:hypothetical protein CRG98_015138 [Punica granatum]
MVTTDFENEMRVIKARSSKKGFVLWQMNPRMWYVELAAGDNSAILSCDPLPIWRDSDEQHEDRLEESWTIDEVASKAAALERGMSGNDEFSL